MDSIDFKTDSIMPKSPITYTMMHYLEALNCIYLLLLMGK